MLEDKNLEPIVDPELQGNYNPDEMVRLIACANASVRHSARRRPRVSQVSHMQCFDYSDVYSEVCGCDCQIT